MKPKTNHFTVCKVTQLFLYTAYFFIKTKPDTPNVEVPWRFGSPFLYVKVIKLPEFQKNLSEKLTKNNFVCALVNAVYNH